MRSIIGVCLFALVSCGQIEVEVPEPVEVEVELVVPHIKQVNGIIYILTVEGCIAIDQTTLYPDEWVTVGEFDDSRQSNYSLDEIEICGNNG